MQNLDLPPCTQEQREHIEALFSTLRRRTLSPGGRPGITRETYGDGETLAMQIVAEHAAKAGLKVSYDPAANLVIELEGADPDLPIVTCGSHLDSVREGGNYDGAAGVLAGVLALTRIREAGVQPPHRLRVMALRGEESDWFGECYLGTRAMFGLLQEDTLERRSRAGHNRTLAEAMVLAGADVEQIRRAEPMASPENFACYLELHIEQGPVLVHPDVDVPMGIVTGIRGNYRFKSAHCEGQVGHSGAVPRWLRRDAVMATSELVSRLDEEWERFNRRGKDLVLTVGEFRTGETAGMTKIPGRVDFTLEFRSRSASVLDEFEQLVQKLMADIEQSRSVRFHLGERVPTPPAQMDPRLIEHLCRICEDASTPYQRLPSGAGHDAVIFSNAGVPSAMIFVRNAHGSHNPDEQMALDDFFKAADVLASAMLTASAALNSMTAGPEKAAVPLPAHAPPAVALSRTSGLRTARLLLDKQAVTVRPDEPFYFTSGWASPIYVDVRKLIADVPTRQILLNQAFDLLLDTVGVGSFNSIVAAEIAGAPFATALAERLCMPLAIARRRSDSDPIIGVLPRSRDVLLVGDLTTDGRSKQELCRILRRAGHRVSEILVMFQYGIYSDLPSNSEAHSAKVRSLCTLHDIWTVASEQGSFRPDEHAALSRYMQDPEAWSQRHRAGPTTLV